MRPCSEQVAEKFSLLIHVYQVAEALARNARADGFALHLRNHKNIFLESKQSPARSRNLKWSVWYCRNSLHTSQMVANTWLATDHQGPTVCLLVSHYTRHVKYLLTYQGSQFVPMNSLHKLPMVCYEVILSITYFQLQSTRSSL